MKYNPINNPGRFLRYGSGAYKILCYARFRRNKAFSSNDYKKFVLNSIDPKRLDESLHALTGLGYLKKYRLGTPFRTNDNGSIRYVYEITSGGHHALVALAEQRRQKDKRTQKQNNSNNGLVRWRKEQQLSKFSIWNK